MKKNASPHILAKKWAGEGGSGPNSTSEEQSLEEDSSKITTRLSSSFKPP